jgi:rare lipoprotein A
LLEGRTIAADSSIPFGTQIYIPELGKTFTVTDRGGAIKGDRLDMYMEDPADALKFGDRELEVRIKYLGKIAEYYL